MKRKPLLIALAVVLLGAVIAAAALRDFRHAEQVELERVERRPLRAVVSASGWLRPRRRIDVSANTMGKVVELAVREGDPVEPGQLLLRIDPVRYRGEVERSRAALRAARADLQAAETTLAEARETLAREERLAERDLSSRERIEKARWEVERTEASVGAGRARVAREEAVLGTAQHELEQVTVTSELAGIVTRLNVEEGENVVTGTMNNPGTVLLSIADLSEMEVRLEVDETDIVDLRRGMPAEITVDAFPDTVLPGRVIEIGHAPLRSAGRAGETSADFEVVVRLEALLEGMRPGLSASAELVTATRDSALSVSIGALAYRDSARERRAWRAGGEEDGDGGGGAGSAATAAGRARRREVYGLFGVEGGRARFQPVEVGITGERRFEIVAGVAEGEQVIAGPFRVLRDLQSGDRVRVSSSKTRARRRARAGD